MYEETEIRRIYPSVKPQMQRVERLLSDAGLRPERLPYIIGIYDSDDNLIGTGGLDGNVIKCIAVDREARSGSLSNRIVSHLLAKAREDGHSNVFIFTKPEYEQVFGSLSFHTVGRSASAVLLESDPRGISGYTAYLSSLGRGKTNGAIVMNCNPLTRGHLHLIRSATAQVDRLFIIPVREDRSAFPYCERIEMLRRATCGMENVTVCEGSQYSISAATFPTYFIKELSSAAQVQMELDCDIFNRHIAPALDLNVRFAGTEPGDGLTCAYNRMMEKCLDIELRTVERLCDGGGRAISASRVRNAIGEGRLSDEIGNLPECSRPYVLAQAAADALTRELELTPKPGLVDLHDSGAHSDMDADTMRRSIAALRPWFARLADSGLAAVAIRSLGCDAEREMLAATSGVNTHKGALFCIGLTLSAAARCLEREGFVAGAALQREIAAIASDFAPPTGTHGAEVTRRYRVGGALAQARGGYADLFADWLPFYRERRRDSNALHLLLLRIMSRIDDTNVYHRCGEAAATRMKEEASLLLENFSTEELERMNMRFIKERISPGGAADMLSLTLLIDSIIP